MIVEGAGWGRGARQTLNLLLVPRTEGDEVGRGYLVFPRLQDGRFTFLGQRY
jgi:hypothetical protein